MRREADGRPTPKLTKTVSRFKIYNGIRKIDRVTCLFSLIWDYPIEVFFIYLCNSIVPVSFLQINQKVMFHNFMLKKEKKITELVDINQIDNKLKNGEKNDRTKRKKVIVESREKSIKLSWG